MSKQVLYLGTNRASRSIIKWPWEL